MNQHPRLHLKLVLNVEYEPNGASSEELTILLQQFGDVAQSNQHLVSGTGARVLSHLAEVYPAQELQSIQVEDLEAFLHRQIDNGELQVDDMVSRMVRYGLMDPAQFAIEMNERLEMSAQNAEFE